MAKVAEPVAAVAEAQVVAKVAEPVAAVAVVGEIPLRNNQYPVGLRDRKKRKKPYSLQSSDRNNDLRDLGSFRHQN